MLDLYNGLDLIQYIKLYIRLSFM